MLPKENRLTNSQDIQQVVRRGQSFFSQHAGVKFLKNQHNGVRFGIIVSLKISKKAVVRNQLQRRIRAIIFELLPNIRPGYNIVILTKPILVNLNYQELHGEIEYLFKKSRLLNQAPTNPHA